MPGDVVEGAEAALALAHDVLGAVAGGEVADDAGNRAHRIKVRRRRLVDGRVALHDEADLAAAAARLLGGCQRQLAANRQRDDGARKDHGIAHRQDDQHVLRDDGGSLAGPCGGFVAARSGLVVLQVIHCSSRRPLGVGPRRRHPACRIRMGQ